MMLLVVFILLLLGLVGYLVYSILSNPETLNWFVVSALVVAVGLTGYGEYKWQSGINAGNHLLVNATEEDGSRLACQRLSETLIDADTTELAYAKPGDPPTVYMKYILCQSLVDWIHSDKKTATDEQVYALHVLIREGFVLKNPEDKTAAECDAQEKFVEAAVRAGASQEESERMKTVYNEIWLPQLAEEYKTYAC